MNGFGFDSAAQFFGESAFDDGFSNTDSNGFGGSFFTESGDFSGNGFGDSSFIGESVGYTGGMSQFGSVFSESAFGEDGFSTDGMFCESKYTRQTGEQWGNYYAAKNGSDAKGNNAPKQQYQPSKGELDPFDDAGERARWDRKRTEMDNNITNLRKKGDPDASYYAAKKQDAAKQHEATMAKIQARRDKAGEIGEANIKNNNPLHAKVRKIQK